MTSHSTSLIPDIPDTSQPPQPLRVQLSGSPGRATLDGAWWPHSRDIEVELADLVDRLPADIGRVHRVLYSRPDWDTQPRSVPVARGRVKTGSFPRDDTHLIVLSMSTRRQLRLLVVPHDEPLGELAMAIAADPSNRLSAAQILAACRSDEAVGEVHDHWTDDGGSWWRAEDGPPSFRRAAPH